MGLSLKNSGRVYECLVQEIYKEILKSEGVNNIKVEHDITLKGKTTKHQIDVYWEHEVGNSKFRTIIQAKDWESSVPQKEMLAFVEIIRDLPTGTKGVFITKSGYQKGAINVAKANGIDIYVLRAPNTNDFKNKMMKMQLNLNIEMLYYKDIRIEIDKNKNTNINGGRLPISGDLIIHEKDKNKTVKELIIELCKQNGKDIKESEYEFKEGYIMIEEQKIFIDKLIGKFGISQTTEQMNIDGYDSIGLILKDIVNRESKIFNKQNKLIKDLKE